MSTHRRPVLTHANGNTLAFANISFEVLRCDIVNNNHQFTSSAPCAPTPSHSLNMLYAPKPSHHQLSATAENIFTE